MGSGGENAQQGDYGETWLRTVAAASGLLHGRPTTLDLEKADVELVRTGLWGGAWNPTVKVQMKTASDLRVSDGHFLYDLDIATYDVLRRENEAVPRVLVVFRVPKTGEKIRLLRSGTLLAGCGAWASLEGHPPSTNRSTQVVRLPVENTIDRKGLERMLTVCARRSWTPVNVVERWEKS